MKKFNIIYFPLTISAVIAADVDVFAVNAYWFTDPVSAPYNYFASTIIVPAVPQPAWQTLFFWPGLQPLNAPNYFPIDNGVLQPVLTYGPSCAPNPNNLEIDFPNQWWISAQYVNTFGNHPGHVGCLGGDRMIVSPRDELRLVMELVGSNSNGTVWRQIVTNLRNGQSVQFSIDMLGQPQAWAEYVMEIPGGWHSNVPTFEVRDIELRTVGSAASASPLFCDFKEKVLPLPDARLNCATPVRQPASNSCKIDYCYFNKNQTISASRTTPIATQTATPTTQPDSSSPHTSFSGILSMMAMVFLAKVLLL